MYQQITLIGNLGGNVELRNTPSGVPVAAFSLATSRTWTDGNGQRQEKTLWLRVTAWRKLGETASKYLAKGSKVLIVGELEEPRTWTDKEGNTRASLEVTASEIRFLDSKSDSRQDTVGDVQLADTAEIPF